MANYSSIYSEMESEVRSYCRKFPVEFSKARNSELFTKDGHDISISLIWQVH